MIFSEGKNSLKGVNGNSSFYTTQRSKKNVQNIGVLSSIKPFSCIPVSLLAYNLKNYRYLPYSIVCLYNINTEYKKRCKLKCI